MKKETVEKLKLKGIDFLTLIKEFFLLIISLLFIVFGMFGILYTAIKHLFKLDYSFSKQLSPIIRGITLANDGFGNSAAGELLNDIFKPTKVKYGKWYQTISAVTGANYLLDKSQKIISKFRYILNKIFGENHCEDAVTDNDKKALNITWKK